MLFPADKIKDARVTVLRHGRRRVLGSSNCLLLLPLQAYWRHFNPVETRIVPSSILLIRLQHPTLTPKVAAVFFHA